MTETYVNTARLAHASRRQRHIGCDIVGTVTPPPSALRRLVLANWKVALYVLLIVLCVLFAPEKPLKFIYTEF